MNYQISYEKRALIELRKLDKFLAKRIVKKIVGIIDNPKRYLLQLINIDSYKLRVGDYRIFVDYSENDKKLIIRSIKHRKNAYNK